MCTAGRACRGCRRIGVRVWREEVERYGEGSPARTAAENERPALERDGLGLVHLQSCAELGADGTRLGGLVKV